MKKKHSLLLGVLFISFITQAQTSDSASAKEKVEFKIGVNYNSHLNYYGRTDSLKSSGLYPSAELSYKGLYVKSDFIFINNSLNSNQYTGTIVSAGYNFKDASEKISGNIFASKFIYQDKTVLVQSALKGQAGGSISFLNKFLNINLGGDVKFSDQADIGANAGADHLERYELNGGKTVFVIDPSVYVYAGTQNFTTTYYKQKNILFLPAGEEAVTERSKKFNMLAYEISAPVALGTGKFVFSLTPSYIIPQNLITVPGHPEQSEKADNLFYVTAGVSYTFW
ncbi:MAG: hypothetical protein HYR66_08430 [Sphingobacteriales bacterium]|nr:hypothetical protein [Sphingobacteriales bacterium]MBI3718125.1 hypothetical protein [Sphingobacteriales bacterium]